MVKEDDIKVKIGKEDVNVEAEDSNKKAKPISEEAESLKPVSNKERNIDLQLDLEKSDRDSGTGSVGANRLNNHVQKLQHQQPSMEKTGKIDPPCFLYLFLPGKIPSPPSPFVADLEVFFFAFYSTIWFFTFADVNG